MADSGMVRLIEGTVMAEQVRDASLAELSSGSIGNRLLCSLADADFAALHPHCRRVPLMLGEKLAEAGDPITQVCFPEGGVIGLIDAVDDDHGLAVGLVGREGMVGWPLALDNDRWPHHAVVRAESATAILVDAPALCHLMAERPGLQRMLLRYTSSFMTQMARTISSNLIHSVEQRTARWILLYNDRVNGSAITLTHEELGIMLGVRRSSITDALHALEGAGAVKAMRGRLEVRDRSYLELLAGRTYGFAETEYVRLVERAD